MHPAPSLWCASFVLENICLHTHSYDVMLTSEKQASQHFSLKFKTANTPYRILLYIPLFVLDFACSAQLRPCRSGSAGRWLKWTFWMRHALRAIMLRHMWWLEIRGELWGGCDAGGRVINVNRLHAPAAPSEAITTANRLIYARFQCCTGTCMTLDHENRCQSRQRWWV